MLLRLVALPFALSSPLRADVRPEAVLGREDTAFARELYRAGYADLAEKFCAVLQKSGKISSDQEVELKALHLDLRLEVARAENDAAKRKDLIVGVVREKEAFVRAYPQSREAEEALATLPDVYRQLGEALAALIEKEDNANALAGLRKEGEDAFTRAAESLELRIADLKEKRSDENPRIEELYIVALYNLPRTYYFHALIYPAGEFKKEKLLEDAIKGFQEFGLDYSDRLLNYEGLVYCGLANKQLGKVNDALEDFGDAIGLRERYEKDEKSGLFLLPPEAAEVVSVAALQVMLLHREANALDKAIAVAKDYFATVADGLRAGRGMALLAEQAECHVLEGNPVEAQKAAQKGLDAEPNGPYSSRLAAVMSGSIKTPGGGLGSVGPEKLVILASGMIQSGELDPALDVARAILSQSKGSPDEAKFGAEAYYLIGTVYAMRQWPYEAAVAFDAAYERYPKAERTPDAVSRSIDTYLALNGAEKRAFYKRRQDDRLTALATQYPTHPNAASAQLIEGKQAEQEGNFPEAADLYLRIPKGSKAYEEARFRAGNCNLKQARKFFGDRKTAEAKPFVDKAEALLKEAHAEATAAEGRTADTQVQQRLRDTAFSALATLAQLYLLPEVHRESEVVTLLQGADEKYGGDAANVATLWSLQIQSLQAQGKLEDAVNLLDKRLTEKPDLKQLAIAAGVLARALDTKAVEVLAKDPKSRDADELWKKAARYYELSVLEQLRGSENVRGAVVEAVAKRLDIIARHFNGLGDDEDFLGREENWKLKEPVYFEKAAEVLNAAQRASPSYRIGIKYGRALGFLGRWKDSAEAYARVFDQERSVLRSDAGGRERLNASVLRDKPELLTALVERAVAEHIVGREEKSAERLERAERICAVLKADLNDPSTKNRWFACYYLSASLYYGGKYKNADLVVRDIETGFPNFDEGKFGLKEKFLRLKDELKPKVPK